MSLLNESYWSTQSITTDSLGDEYCLVPAGNFLFGSSNREVRIRAAFYIGKYPVPRWRFEEFIDNTGYDYSPEYRQIMYRLAPKPECPATPISWLDAKAYARWLRACTQQYYSLPSIEEWEVSARGTDGRIYPWGNEEPTEEHMRYSASLYHDTTKPIGSYPTGQSPYGCMGMVGNVWEWNIDPVDEEERIHLLRGGSCVNNHHFCNTLTAIWSAPPERRVLFAGFRLIYLSERMYEEYTKAAAQGEPDITQTYY
jgi:formylglycine-generating enzyme required for sulfatase activity